MTQTLGISKIIKGKIEMKYIYIWVCGFIRLTTTFCEND